jgi:hypothetical protein
MCSATFVFILCYFWLYLGGRNFFMLDVHVKAVFVLDADEAGGDRRVTGGCQRPC